MRGKMTKVVKRGWIWLITGSLVCWPEWEKLCWKGGGGEENENAPGSDFNAPLSFHVSCWQIGTTIRPSKFFHRRETIWRRSDFNSEEEAGGVGWKGKKGWRGGGCAGVQSLKISQTAEHTAWLQQPNIPSISAIFVAFSIMSGVCLISWWQRNFSGWGRKRHDNSVSEIIPSSKAAFYQSRSFAFYQCTFINLGVAG